MANASFSLHTKDRKRQIQDRLARGIVSFGGLSVLAGLIFIFVYLAFVTLPIFSGATSTWSQPVPMTLNPPIIASVVDDNAENVRFYTQDGLVTQQSLATGKSTTERYADDNHTVTVSSKLLTLTRNSNELTAFEPSIIQDGNNDTLAPHKQNEKAWITATTDQQPIELVSAALNNNMISFVTLDRLGRVHLIKDALAIGATATEQTAVATSLNRFDNQAEIQNSIITTSFALPEIEQVLLTPSAEVVYARAANELYVLVLQDRELVVREVVDLSVVSQSPVMSMELLSGAYSLLIQYQNQQIWQWFDVLADRERTLTPIRSFDISAPIERVLPETLSKGFYVQLANGELEGHYTTSEKALSSIPLPSGDIHSITLSSNNRYAALLIDDALHVVKIENNHPEISWSALWGKVWYESYPEPEFVWQTTAANDDFEAKFSLVPIAFGTLKAAGFAMLFAVPIAIFGAIYTAYFMSSSMRKVVKPTIELMEALPTVIIGFLAGLWFAPIVESHLPAVMMLLISLPLLSLATGVVWYLIPRKLTTKLPSGLHPFTLIPVIIAAIYLMMTYSYDMEVWLFGGDVRVYLAQHGIDYDQRNALVVGFAMGFAVIPTIFTIAEDAIFSVPKHLCDGSLALGATQWQTLLYVVLLTASPGIFSAVMMGLGRAVGETMIVLMATGNTPILDWNIFEGMRTLSATMAVELPESDVGSTHYRLLFLIALILFSFTFVVNSMAEWVRQRLRDKYSAL
ncbi:ABC transporter permease subunit [Vibrio methylphosphonaticus]|uniref:ABC transporter permease subunit n=1 Tax=Vibrio methylphosphonaticus TaxID=2946866 RepID=UPI00202AB455|nr:ABC transporter permease subunit [Vibrio methylphosphonaticus]MCL9775944.1 ABC transporter permease subunit [Vibrio methylphosphonaticus]